MPKKMILRWTLNTQILLGAAIGIAAGYILGHTSCPPTVASPLLFIFGLFGKIFISLLKMIVVPLVFTSLTAGIANLQLTPQTHRMWWTLFLFFLFTTTVAAATGLLAANIFKPGAGLDIHVFKDSMSAYTWRPLSLDGFGPEFVQALFANPVTAMAQNNILAVIVFAMLTGIAIFALNKRAQTVLTFINELSEIIMTMVGWIMRLAPLGIMGLLAELVAHQDLHLLNVLNTYIAVVMGTTFLHGFVTLPAILWLTTGIRPWVFFRAVKDALITAFATSSSSATLPVGLRCVTQNLKVDKNIAGFVLPIGATLNMDGTALYEAMAALFVANLCGIHLSLAQQIIVGLTAMVAAVGAPGIPSAGMVTMMMVLQAVGLPVEAVAILIPIDRPLDTLRTVVNVEGDYIAACLIQKTVDPRHNSKIVV